MKSKVLQISVALAALAFFSTAANAFIPQGTHQQREDCHADAMRLCQHHVPHVGNITACMQANVRHLSPACRRHFR